METQFLPLTHDFKTEPRRCYLYVHYLSFTFSSPPAELPGINTWHHQVLGLLRIHFRCFAVYYFHLIDSSDSSEKNHFCAIGIIWLKKKTPRNCLFPTIKAAFLVVKGIPYQVLPVVSWVTLGTISFFR